MPLYKRDIRDKQSGFRVSEADVTKLSDDQSKLYYEIFSDKFLRDYSKSDSFREFINKSPSDLDDIGSLESDEFNRFVSRETVFDDWEEMKDKAVEEWIASEIDL